MKTKEQKQIEEANKVILSTLNNIENTILNSGKSDTNKMLCISMCRGLKDEMKIRIKELIHYLNIVE